MQITLFPAKAYRLIPIDPAVSRAQSATRIFRIFCPYSLQNFILPDLIIRVSSDAMFSDVIDIVKEK